MDVIRQKVLLAGLIGTCSLLPFNSLLAVARNYPADLPTVAPPYTMANADTLSINSGTMQTVSSNPLDTFTIKIQQNNAITIQAGATLTYQGADSVGNTIYMNRADNTATTETITNLGTLSSGLGAFAIYLANSGTASVTNNIVNINNSSTIIGSIFTGGPDQVFLNIDGSGTISGSITLKSRTESRLNIGQTTAANFTNVGTINDVSLIRVFNGSTFNLRNTAANIKAITVENGGTANLYSTVGGANAPDGAITNNGNLNLYSNITKTGSFNTSATGITNVYENITVSTTGVNGYTNSGVHNAVMNDVLHFGTLNLPVAIPNFNTFKIAYGNGFLAAGDYVLVNATNGIGVHPVTVSAPANTKFVTFGSPTVVGNKIITTISRHGYQYFATIPLTRRFATVIEAVGAGSPSGDLIHVLNALEATNDLVLLNAGLNQLCPLTSAPLHGFEIQNDSLNQVELRLASLRTTSSYIASGDFAKDNAFWLRPFGNLANQRYKDDIFGYYATTGGLAFGLDRALDEKFILGAAGSYALSHVKDKVSASSNTFIKSYQVMLYGTYNFTTTRYLDWIFGVAANNFNGLRYINIGTLNLVAKSRYSSQQYSAKLTWGKDYAFSDFIQLTPLASLQHTFAKQYRYTETDAPGANLAVSRANSNILQAGLGLKLALPIALDPAVFVPEAHAIALYNAINSSQDTIFNFIDGGGQVRSTMKMARGGLKLGCSLTFARIGSLDIKLNYDHEVRDRYTNNSFFLNFKYTL